MKFIKIPVEGDITTIDTDDYPNAYEAIRTNVGGWLEAVSLGEDHATLPNHRMYLDEEGKINDLPVNNRATSLTRGVVAHWDMIVGDVVICGPVDGMSRDTDYGTGLDPVPDPATLA